MRFVALAAGFDGTLARDGRCDERCIEALKAIAATGRKLILVTARELRELLEIFPHARLFDYVVAENGAVMHQPASRESEILAQAPSEILLQELARRRVYPLTVGSSIITTSLLHRASVEDAIKKLQLDCQLVANGSALIVLPSEVNKASGVREALRQLGVSAHNLVVIGDAQNDLALFQLAEHSVAVHNADSLLKQCASRTTQGAFCDGFLELARDLIEGDLAYAQPKVSVALGQRGSDVLTLAPYYDSLLVCGPRGSGKAVLCNRLFEGLLAEGYQCCIITAGLRGGLNAPAGMRICGSAHEAPRLSEIMGVLEHPAESVAVNLAALPAESRPVFTEALLLQLQALHDRAGHPHSVLIHEAHWFLSSASSPSFATRLMEMTMVYASEEPQLLPLDILQGVLSVVALGDNATIPEQFSGFGDVGSVRLEVTSALEGPRAQVWIRAQRPAALASVLQATAGGAVCRIPELRESASDSLASPTDSEASSLSGY
jgi:hydroxymethylpyrimidine pyrophosphatase-like HAD family hydrolase/GTPase SAR1 family protein